MDPEVFMNLFDSCWFNLEIFKKQSKNSANSETNPDQRIEENPKVPKFSSCPTILIRSKSDKLSSETSFHSDFLSPNSVLWTATPKLKTIVSGKEATKEEEESITKEKIEVEPKKNRGMRRRAKKGLSKSLSELEFEEVKGFIDLGFVFSEEDKETSLVEIVPGLQRLGKKKDGHDQQVETSSTVVDQSSVARPYLSESWEVLYTREKVKPLMNLTIHDLGNEIDMKDSLKWWAHTVASAVR